MYDFAADDAADELSKIARELRTANLIAYHDQLDFMGAQAKALRTAIITALNEGN